MSKEAMKLALKALRFARDDGYENEVSQDAITALREALVEQPAKQDIPDLIAGTLGVSRGTAYDLMREALAEAQQEPVDIEHCLWARNGNTPCPHTSTPAQEPVAWLDPWTQDNVTTDYDAYGKHGIPLYTRPQAREPEPPAQGCDFCNNPLYAGTVCKNCGRVAEQPAQSLPFGVGGGLVAIKTLLSRDPCGHANTAIQMIDAILAEQPAQQEPVNLHQVLTDPENQPNQYGIEFGMHGEKMMFKVGVQQFALDYEPDTQDEFNFMRDMLIHAFSTFTHDVKITPPAAQPAPVQKPLFADIIAHHPGLADELKAVDAAPVAVPKEYTMGNWFNDLEKPHGNR